METGDQPEFPNAQPAPQSGHTQLAKAATVIGLIVLCLGLVCAGLLAFPPKPGPHDAPAEVGIGNAMLVAMIGFWGLVLSLVGLVLGIIAASQKSTKKRFAIIGIVLNVPPLLWAAYQLYDVSTH